jgi:hypothetical protein
MRSLMKMSLAIAGVVGLMLAANSNSSAQKLPKTIYIQAQAMGTSTQMGRNANITLIINELSTEEERAGLLEAFATSKNEGLVNALEKMHSKGRMSITGTLGYDIAYAKTFTHPDGSTTLRVVTNRPLQFGEVYSSSRSSDYNLSGVEINISKDRKKKTGTLYPLCRLKMNKQNQLELELFQNPWNLINIMKR